MKLYKGKKVKIDPISNKKERERDLRNPCIAFSLKLSKDSDLFPEVMKRAEQNMPAIILKVGDGYVNLRFEDGFECSSSIANIIEV